MKIHNVFFTWIISGLLLAAFSGAPQVTFAYSLYSATGFLELLLERGIVAQDKSEKAKEIIAYIQNVEATRKVAHEWKNADHVSVSVSQYIQYGDLRYGRYEDIQGLLLVVKNTTEQDIVLEAKRGCQVTYTIEDEQGDVLFDSTSLASCNGSERVTYLLEGNASRMFEVTHARRDFALAPGTYTFTLEYEGYGSGEKTVTVTQ